MNNNIQFLSPTMNKNVKKHQVKLTNSETNTESFVIQGSFHDFNECLDSKPRTLIIIFVTFDLKSKC